MSGALAICAFALARIRRARTITARLGRLMLQNKGLFPSLCTSTHRLDMTPRTPHQRLHAVGSASRCRTTSAAAWLARILVAGGGA